MDEELLKELGFVYLAGGPVQLGADRPLACRLEGHRLNETPVRQFTVSPFWICRYCVTNQEYEQFNPKHRRPLTSPRDKHPVTEVTYLNALNYAAWLSTKHGLEFTLPTEQQWVFAAAPFGWDYPWGNELDRRQAHVFNIGSEGPVEVDDASFPTNYCGLFHIGGNVQEYVLGTAYAPGTNGAAVDGMYAMFKGGDWSHCVRSPGVHRRGLADVSGRAPTIGLRLVVANI